MATVTLSSVSSSAACDNDDDVLESRPALPPAPLLPPVQRTTPVVQMSAAESASAASVVAAVTGALDTAPPARAPTDVKTATTTAPTTTAVAAPPKKKKKQKIRIRAYINFPTFPTKGSATLAALTAFLGTAKNIAQIAATDGADKPDIRHDTTPSQAVASLNKYMRYAMPTAATADDVDLYTVLRDHVKIEAFLKELRDKEATLSTVFKYVRAMEDGLRYLASGDLTMERRSSVERMREWFVKIKKQLTKPRTKETRRRNTREKMEEKGSWIDLKELARIVDGPVAKECADLLRMYGKKAPNAIPQDMAIRFRECTVMTVFVKAKLCRPMIYEALDEDEWEKLQRDEHGCKYLSSDYFKTSGRGFDVDAVVFPKEVEELIDQYRTVFRPKLSRTGESKALFLSSSGIRMTRMSDDVERVIQRHAPDTGKITITILRKVLRTSAVEQLGEEAAHIIAVDQRHADVTAKASYEKRKSVQVAQQSATLQRKLMGYATVTTTTTTTTATATTAPPASPPTPVPTTLTPATPTSSSSSSSSSSASPGTSYAAASAAAAVAMAMAANAYETKAPAPEPVHSSPLIGPAAASPLPKLHSPIPSPGPSAPKPRKPASIKKPTPAAAADAEADDSSSSTRTTGLFTEEMDDVLKGLKAVRGGKKRATISWTGAKEDHASLFRNVSAEQMRWRYAILMKHAAAGTAPVAAGTAARKVTPRTAKRAVPKKRKRDSDEDSADDPTYEEKSSSSSSAAAADVPEQQPVVKHFKGFLNLGYISPPRLSLSPPLDAYRPSAFKPMDTSDDSLSSAAAAATVPVGPALHHIDTAKVIGGRLYVRCSTSTNPSEYLWLAETAVEHDPLYQTWLRNS